MSDGEIFIRGEEEEEEEKEEKKTISKKEEFLKKLQFDDGVEEKLNKLIKTQQ